MMTAARKEYHRQYRIAHRPKKLAYARQWYATNKEDVRIYSEHRYEEKRKLANERLQQQCGLCAICGTPLIGLGHDNTLGKCDHDHRIGSRLNVKAWRGILCHLCNCNVVGCLESVVLIGLAPRERKEVLSLLVQVQSGV